MVYMGSQKSSGDHFLGIVFNEESHGDFCFTTSVQLNIINPPSGVKTITKTAN